MLHRFLHRMIKALVFSIAALMMLFDEGKVSLNDPLGKFLPDFKGQLVKEADGTLHVLKHPITVREVIGTMCVLDFA